MAPTTLYGHIVSATEIVAGMTFTAIFTGLLFVRFSRPKAKIVFAEHALINRHATPPTLSLRLANGRVTLMSDATVRLFVLMIQPGQGLRSIQELHLQQSRLPVFVMPWIVSHLIDETSPLHGHDADSLGKADARLLLTIEVRDHVLATMVHDTKAYRISNIRFDMRFAETVTSDGAGHMTGDLSRINLLEPIGAAPPDA
jgi:inward rectifier potassium channel